jgi:hypothetical protein
LTRYIANNKRLLLTPKAAYVTFEEEDGCGLASDLGSLRLYGADTDVAEAIQPTDVKFENVDWTSTDRIPYKIYITIVMILMLIASAISTGIARNVVLDLTSKYMNFSACDEIMDIFEPEELATQSANDWYHFYKSEPDSNHKVSEILNCYCASEQSEHGYHVLSFLVKDSLGREN